MMSDNQQVEGQQRPFALSSRLHDFVPGRGSLTAQDTGVTEDSVIWWLSALVMLIITMLLLEMTVGTARQSAQFWEHAVRTTGSIVECSEVPGGSKQFEYTAVVVVHTEVDERDSPSYRMQHNLPARFSCDDVYAAETIGVAYDADNPQDARIVDERFDQSFGSSSAYAIEPLIVMAVPALIGLAALVKAVAITRYNERARRWCVPLARSGQIISGEVVKARLHSKAIGTKKKRKMGMETTRYRRYLTLRYRFVSPQTGAEITGRQRRQRDDLNKVTIPQTGQPVRVLYLDDTCYIVL